MPDGAVSAELIADTFHVDKGIFGHIAKINGDKPCLITDLDIHEAVAFASLNPAKALGVDSEIGSLESGKCADIIITDEKFDVRMTITDGEIRYKGEEK